MADPPTLSSLELAILNDLIEAGGQRTTREILGALDPNASPKFAVLDRLRTRRLVVKTQGAVDFNYQITPHGRTAFAAAQQAKE